ncbi:MAG: urea carboxylase [Acidobacteriota bacterium]|jgi:allophanate hydrolase subunit 2|nr:urea carboxylase [Acidobacteriota bacterium]
MRIAEVIAPGQLTTIVAARDWSRAEYGVTPGGPFDERAAAIANRACGNASTATLLECVLVGPRLRFETRTRVAIFDGALRVEDVVELDVGRLRNFRAWIAIAGGIDAMLPRYAEAPRVLKRGDVIPSVSEGSGWAAREEAATRPARPDPSLTLRMTVRVLRGPHNAPFESIDCDVTPQLDRVGIRLRPLIALPPAPKDLPSIGMQFGSVQQHADGSLAVMGPDHPVTGGYLQPVTVLSSELWKLAQLAPGERVRLVVSDYS